MTHNQCDARPVVTFPAVEHHRTSTGITTALVPNHTVTDACVLVESQLNITNEGIKPKGCEQSWQLLYETTD